MLKARKNVLYTILALIFSFAIPRAVLSQEVQQEVSDEYRTVAKHIAAGLHESLKAAQLHYKRPTNDYAKEMDRLILDMEKIETDDPDIKKLVSLALPAAETIIEGLHNIRSIPGMSDDEFVEHMAMMFITAGEDNTGYKKSASRRDAIKAEEQKMNRAALELHRARDLLPLVAKKYAPGPTKSSSIQVGFHQTDKFNDFPNKFFITNHGDDLKDCIIVTKASGKNDATVTDIYFVEQWPKNTTLWSLHTTITHVPESLIDVVTTIDVDILSPDLNTTVNYSYDRAEWKKTYAWVFKNVKLTAKYSEASEGIFDNWARSATIYMEGFSRLPPCTLSVTFDGEGKTYSASDSGWTEGNGWTIKGGNKLEDKCKSYTAEVTFPQTDFKIKESWTINP